MAASYGGSTHPALLAAIRRLNAPDDAKAVLLATTWAESGGNPYGDPGDGGESWGAYQEYTHGRGKGLTPQQRQDPVASTNRAWREFQTYYNKGARGGELAYRAQRPANQSAYINKVNSYLDKARQVLGQGGPATPTASPATGVSPNGNPTQPTDTGNAGLVSAVSGSVASRQKGESLFDSVMRGVMTSVLDQPATSQRDGVTKNPAGGQALAQEGGGDGQGLLAAGRRYLGTPYSWGGGTPSGPTKGIQQGANTVGFDCSSLVQMIWAKQGVQLPRVTYDQIKVGRAIQANDMSRWKVGDLLFPSTGHVQMYAGNGKVIEAPRTGGVVQEVPARSSYIAVRRPRG